MNNYKSMDNQILSDKTSPELILQFIHCGDAQGDLIEQTSKELENSQYLRVDKKKDRDHKESFLSLGPNIKIKSGFTGKVLDMVSEIISLIRHGNQQDRSLMLKQKETPFFLVLFITPFCPHCPKVVRDISKLVSINPNVYVDIVDGLLYENLAKTFNIKAAPTLVLNENFRWTGQVDVHDVIEVLDHEDPEKLSSKALQTMIETGKASAVASMMVERQIIFKSLIELLLNEKWSVRLGAMVVAEEIGFLDPALGFNLMEFLWVSFAELGDTIKGDIIYLSGVMGDERFIERLEKFMERKNGDELIEAAQEALQSLNDRFGLGN